MSHRDLWDKAAACARAAVVTSDPKMREILVCLGEFWLDLAIAKPDDRSDDRIATELAKIERIHAELLGTVPTCH